MDDKKRLIVLLAILGLSFVGGGIWLYFNMRTEDVPGVTVSAPSFSKVDSVKKLTNKNIQYINSSTSLINSFYKNKRYIELEDNSVEIVVFGVGNPEPFAPLDFSSTEEDEEVENTEE